MPADCSVFWTSEYSTGGSGDRHQSTLTVVRLTEDEMILKVDVQGK